MKILVNNHGKDPVKSWPRLMACQHCKSVLRVEAEDVRTDTKDRWRSILFKYFICEACKGHTIIGHNAFDLSDRLENI
jgi:hypothetical protein